MIMLTRISGQQFVLNCDLIERVDFASDTVVTLVDGKKYIVTETPIEIVAAIRLFRSETLALSHHLPVGELIEAHAPEQRRLSPPIPLREV